MAGLYCTSHFFQEGSLKPNKLSVYTNPESIVFHILALEMRVAVRTSSFGEGFR